ncbi:hypothetical protein VNO78_22829 [Psophocarpus tetragonolobus]|uniref:Pectinesterase inhibitor domain-containing protein n=1 Tax=Psophocarpus tetragonolobus TaxID=3891 RepID=A0AAN9S2I6_PSOTE
MFCVPKATERGPVRQEADEFRARQNLWHSFLTTKGVYNFEFEKTLFNSIFGFSLAEMKCLVLIWSIILIATISMPTANCRVMEQNKANLIEETCKQTPHDNLCIQYLSSDPRSTHADVSGLALIMVDVIKTKSNNVLDKIQKLLEENPEPGLKEALSSCADRYKAILQADVAQAVAALQKGDPKFAEDGANDAAIEATSCENTFSGQSPLSNDNTAMHDLAATTAAIVRQLL